MNTTSSVPTFETIRIEPRGEGLAHLVLARPAKLNALSARTLRELVAAAGWLNEHLQYRVVVVRGEGRAFSAGADLDDSPAAGALAPDADWQTRREAGQIGLRMANAIEGLRAVTIAQLHGWCVGGGVVLAAACDLRVAAADARFMIPEVELGIPLAWGGIPRLVREIGPALTKELVMTCREFSPEEARAAGFLNRVVAPEQLEEAAQQLAERLLEMPAGPIIATKDHVNAVATGIAAANMSTSDGDVLAGALRDPASALAREAYLARTLRRKKS